MKTVQDQNEKIVNEVRINIVFETFIFSIVLGSGLCAALFFAYGIGEALFGGSLSAYTLVSAFGSAVSAAAICFLIGFFASIALVAPLFKALKAAERREYWPYFAAAVGCFVIYLVAGAAVRGVGALAFSTNVIVAITIAFVARDFVENLKKVMRAKFPHDDNEPRLDSFLQ